MSLEPCVKSIRTQEAKFMKLNSCIIVCVFFSGRDFERYCIWQFGRINIDVFFTLEPRQVAFASYLVSKVCQICLCHISMMQCHLFSKSRFYCLLCQPNQIHAPSVHRTF